MDVFGFIVGILTIALAMLGSFIAGASYMKSVYRDAQEDARRDAMRYEHYRMAGVQSPASPRPYIPPKPRTPKSRYVLPHIGTMARRLKEGKRTVIMWRAGDRRR